jgi:FkbM family methyltransferase
MDDVQSGEPILVHAIFGEVLAFKGDLITGQLIDYGAHTRCELAFLSHFVDRGDTVIDLGAHIGTFTVPLAQRVGPAGRVVAVEADPRNYALLVANVERNGLGEQVRTLNAVAGNSTEEYQLVRNSANTGMSQPVLKTVAHGTAMQGIALNDIVQSEGRVDIIKIVVQGMELDVLRGAEEVLRKEPLLYVQVHSETLGQYGASPAQLGAFLRERHYRFFVNVGDRNAAHDRYVIEEIDALETRGPHINVLAIPNGHERLSRTIPTASSGL